MDTKHPRFSTRCNGSWCNGKHQFNLGGGDLVAVGGKVALLPIPLGTADFLVHHIHAFTIHVTVLILLKGVLFARSSRLIPDKANLGFRFPCDGPGRGGTCQVSAWDHVFLGLFWMYNSISVVIFRKMQSDVWGSISDQGVVTHITGGNFAQSSITINGWLRDFLWAQASQVIQSYGSSLSAYGLFFLGPFTCKTYCSCNLGSSFGKPAVEAFTRGGALGPVNIAYSGVYQWWYTIGLRTNEDLYTGALFLLFLSAISLIAGWLHLQPKWKPSVSWFKNAESRLNHHLSGLFGVSSLAWTGHLVHVAIPGSRGEYVRWNNFLDVLPHPQGLGPLFTGQWNLYAQNPDSSSHLFGTSQGAGTAILTLLGGFHPQTQSLWLTDMAHHHLAIAFIFLVAGHMYRTNFGIGHSIKDLLDAHIPPEGDWDKGLIES
ncbi:UNVERIFIED_CONTAM: Photosystem I chlorophyll a apoprotein A2 [Sesamum calycinum]|uniref:photosystem I n=1 Tax=Sesamum calycinum TaxID=2727403 RepID=A0AAW2JIJ9_9LAMI